MLGYIQDFIENVLVPILIVVLVIAAAVVVTVGGSAFISYHAQTPGEIASIEQARADIARDPGNDFLKQKAISLNMDIARYKKINQMWWSGWTMPDIWDQVEFIEIAK
jgi:hypothetical protein